MADPNRVRIGDTLRIDVKVSDIAAGANYPIETETLSPSPVWIRRAAIEAAEHIPAPKVFYKDDWVRHIACPGKNCPLGIGRVLEVNVFSGDDPDLIKVFFAGWDSKSSKEEGGAPGTIRWYTANELEHDEAPE